MKVTEQLPEANTQLVGLTAPVAVPDVVNETVPVGTVVVPGEESVIVAVHNEP